MTYKMYNSFFRSSKLIAYLQYNMLECIHHDRTSFSFPLMHFPCTCFHVFNIRSFAIHTHFSIHYVCM
ncbi:hypothetical protein GDO86_002956 [Hymenochirus boettgeri]|uniref:Uncharacterized protein n=1 Tax=Hymenochirus boettgeri TaxID=247094 RepID=A0A8T2K780_9PIPI|nr:hypothetical protein GDO86_002956 [Hymenochirus boettgeri]